jgi:hypothetical protein
MFSPITIYRMVFCNYYHRYLAVMLSDSAIFVVTFRDFRCRIPRLLLSLSATTAILRAEKNGRCQHQPAPPVLF